MCAHHPSIAGLYVRRVSLASPGKGGCRPALKAGHSAASRQERNSILIPSAAGLKGSAALSIKSFFRQEAKLRPPREGSGGKARRAGLAPIWRPGCTGARRMPWRRQAMKDAASCEKPRGDACGLRSGGLRMGQPTVFGRCRRTNPWSARREPGEVKHLSSRRKRKQNAIP